jgi:hypothetical protein
MAKAKRRATAHNSLGQFMAKFSHKFDVEEAFIDCKEMSKNYAHGLIPMNDLAQAVDAISGPWQGPVNQYQSTTLAGKILVLNNLTPQFEMVPLTKLFSHPSFNRDTSPNHCIKLEMDWKDHFAMCGLGIKMPEKYGGNVYNADTTHTGVNRIRRGDKELPMWVAEVPDQGSFDDTHEYALFIAGHLFLAINVRNKRGVDIFDQHFIKVSCGIYPSPQIQTIIDNVSGVCIRRAGNKIAGAIHNLNETYMTYDLDAKTATPGALLECSLNWLVRNFKHQSIDGCLMTSFAMLIQENNKAGIVWTQADEDKLAKELSKRYTTANRAQLSIKAACPAWNNPQFAKLDSNYLVSNGLKHIARKLSIPAARDQVRNWDQSF